jgi:hypothetical protein
MQKAGILSLEIRVWILLIMLDPERHKINASAILLKRKKITIKAVLRIGDVYIESEFFSNPDPESKRFRIRI